RHFAKWFRSIVETKLRRPVSDVGPELALSLDAALSADTSWSRREDRHSAALEIVEATYLAALTLSEPGDSALLHETWARSRHSELLSNITQIAPWRLLLTRADHGALLLAESAARRRQRLSAFGISEEN